MSNSSQTQTALANALKRLMASKPFLKISVCDICEASAVSRKSFYYHFRDKYDLVNWIFYTEFASSLSAPERTNMQSTLLSICRYFDRERVFYRNAFSIRGQNCFQDYFCDIVHSFVRPYVRERFHGTTREMDFFVSFYTDAFLSAIIRWLNEDAPIAPEHFASLLTTTLIMAFSAPVSTQAPSLYHTHFSPY